MVANTKSKTVFKKPFRNCKTRKVGSTYMATEEGFFDNFPFSDFTLCPPYQIDASQIGLSNRGVVVAERPDGSGIYDAYDKLGWGLYPPADFFVEISHLGLSRNVDNIMGPQVKLLTPDSMYFIVSDHGWINNAHTLFQNRVGLKDCPKDHEIHNNNDEIADMCIALFWEDMGHKPPNTKSREHQVSLARNRPPEEPAYTTEKYAYWPEGHTSEYSTAIIMSLPAEALLLEIIHDPNTNKAEETANLLEELGSNFYYQVVEE